MKIDGTEFGIIIDGKTYPHDVLIRLSGEKGSVGKSCRKDFTGPHTSCPWRKPSSSTRKAAVC
jgi:hypothetical protein